jgi:glycosyltransferase involved in cell wall biosynthesis
LPEYEFQVVGDGGRKSALIRGLEAAGIGNVQLLLPVPREQLLALYRNADCLFLHLNDYEAFRKVLPSKIFEYAATGKPILAGLAGYSAEFLTRYVENAAVFPPCDAEAAVRALRTLRLAPVERTTFIKRFNRTRIMSAMASDVMALAVQAAKR